MKLTGALAVLAVPAVLTTLAGTSSCYRAATESPLRSNFADVRVSESAPMSVVSAATGEPYSGQLVARDGEITTIARAVLGRTPLSRAASIDPTGLILVMQIERGRVAGRATLEADVRSPTLSRDLSSLSLLSLALAASIAPRVKIAEAHFEGGVLDGPAALFAPASKGATRMSKIAEATFKDNRLDGTARELVAGTAKPRREVSFERGVVSGVQREFFASGSLKREATYRDGKPDGEMREHYGDGSLFRRTIYERGTEVRIEEWFPDGVRRSERVVARGESRFRAWYSSGDLRIERGPAVDIEEPPDGMVIEYHRSGAVHSRTRWRAGVKDGDYEIFYADGTRWESGTFAADRREGVQKKWWKNGKLALESAWKAGALDGGHRRWYASGAKWEEATFVAGKPMGRYQKWWKNGAIAHDYRYVAGGIDGDYRTFYDNGAKWAVGKFVAGKPRGTLRRWFPDGKLGFIKEHIDGRPHGQFRRWYADGRPRLIATYVKGRLEGELENWLEDGTLFEKATYRAGRKLTSTRTPVTTVDAAAPAGG